MTLLPAPVTAVLGLAMIGLGYGFVSGADRRRDRPLLAARRLRPRRRAHLHRLVPGRRQPAGAGRLPVRHDARVRHGGADRRRRQRRGHGAGAHLAETRVAGDGRPAEFSGQAMKRGGGRASSGRRAPGRGESVAAQYLLQHLDTRCRVALAAILDGFDGRQIRPGLAVRDRSCRHIGRPGPQVRRSRPRRWLAPTSEPEAAGARPRQGGGLRMASAAPGAIGGGARELRRPQGYKAPRLPSRPETSRVALDISRMSLSTRTYS